MVFGSVYWSGRAKGSGAGTAALQAKLTVIEHPEDAADRTRILAIRKTWKCRTRDRSVLRVTEPVDILV